MVQLNGLEGVNGNVGQAIPLYQKGFNWIKYWLGFLFGCCLCLILAAAVTFIVLYILTQAGAITATRRGRMMPVNEPTVKGKRTDTFSPIDLDSNLFKKEITERKYFSNQMLREKLLKEVSTKKNFKYSAA